MLSNLKEARGDGNGPYGSFFKWSHLYFCIIANFPMYGLNVDPTMLFHMGQPNWSYWKVAVNSIGRNSITLLWLRKSDD